MYDLLDYATRMLTLMEPAAAVLDAEGTLTIAELEGRRPHDFFAHIAETGERYTMALVFTNATAVNLETGERQRICLGAAITADGATTVSLTPDGIVSAAPTEGSLLTAARAALS